MNPKALILEDDSDLAQVLGKVLVSMGFDTEITHHIAEARRLIRDKSPELMLVDINLPDGNGLDLMAELQHETRGRFIVISGNTSQQAMINSIRSQAADVVVKPVDLHELRSVVTRNFERIPANEAVDLQDKFGDLVSWVEVGESLPLRDLRTVISHAASQHRGNAVIEGDHGTDKYSVARLIHKRSRRPGACICVYCASEQDDRALERFFGFDDPDSGECLHKGYLEQAVGGTLVLDDIVELSHALQSRIMAFIEAGRYTRVNGLSELKATVSVVAISRTKTRILLESGKLRHDLYFRLASYVLRVPKLRQCHEDNQRIADYFLSDANRELSAERELSGRSRAMIDSYNWPGNAKELKNVIFQACLSTSPNVPLELPVTAAVPFGDHDSKEIEEILGKSFWNVEKQMIYATLDHFHGNKEKTARTLGISLKTLYNRLNAYE